MRSAGLWFVIALGGLLLVSCGGSPQKQLSSNFESLRVADLEPSDIKVESFDQQGKDEALLTGEVHMAFLMKKNSRGAWEIVSVRLGDRRWEDARYFAAALNDVMMKQVRSDFDTFSAAIEKYQAQMKKFPAAHNMTELNDLLYPAFMPNILRLDPWSTEYAFNLTEPDSYTIVSAGPDRQFGTADDIRFKH